MKRNLSIILILVVLATSSSVAQITVTRSAMPQIGHQLVTAVDQSTTFDIGNAGPNQTWDYSTAVVEYYDTAIYILPHQAPNYLLYPNADMAGFVSSAEGLAYGFYQDSQTDIGIVGADVHMTIMPGYDFNLHKVFVDPQWLYLPSGRISFSLIRRHWKTQATMWQCIHPFSIRLLKERKLYLITLKTINSIIGKITTPSTEMFMH